MPDSGSVLELREARDTTAALLAELHQLFVQSLTPPLVSSSLPDAFVALLVSLGALLLELLEFGESVRDIRSLVVARVAAVVVVVALLPVIGSERLNTFFNHQQKGQKQ